MNAFLNFFNTQSNLIWVDIGVAIFILFLLFVVFMIGSVYFHYLFSITFILTGLVLLAWPLLYQQINVGYNLLLNSSSVNHGLKEFVSFLQLNYMINQFFVFAVLFGLIFLIFTPIYFLTIRRVLQVFNTPPLAVSFLSKAAFYMLVVFGLFYLFVPFYMIIKKQASDSYKNTYLSLIYEKSKISKVLIPEKEDLFAPVRDELVVLQNENIASADTYLKSLKKFSDFLKDNFPYFYRNWWLKQQISITYKIEELLAITETSDITTATTSEFARKIKSILTTEYKKGIFVFWNKSF